jgi:hypothetical protein
MEESVQILNQKKYNPKWEIGEETFTRLDGSHLIMWYIKGFGDNEGKGAGCFDTEKQALTYLLEQA